MNTPRFTSLRTHQAVAGLTLLLASVTDLAHLNYPLMMASRGVVPDGLYLIGQIEAIDAVSGNLALQIPLAALPPGRSGSGIGCTPHYNSSIFVWAGQQGSRLISGIPVIPAAGITGSIMASKSSCMMIPAGCQVLAYTAIE